MADADWVRYRAIRGRKLPPTAQLHGSTTYRIETTLKYDFYAATGLYKRVEEHDAQAPERLLLKIYHTDPWWFPLLGLLGWYLAHRERHYLRALQDIEGVPGLLGDYGRSGLIREFIEGVHLREYFRGQLQRVGPDYFPRLYTILDQIHERGIAHNDLSKPENVLVKPDGSPAIIDLQIALKAALPRWTGRPLISYLQRVDRYHLRKLHRRQRPEDFDERALSSARRRDPLVWLHGWIRRPYRAVRHFVLGRFLTVDPAQRLPAPHRRGNRAAENWRARAAAKAAERGEEG